MAIVIPIELHVPDDDLVDLRERLARTRWSPALADADWDYGTDRATCGTCATTGARGTTGARRRPG